MTGLEKPNRCLICESVQKGDALLQEGWEYVLLGATALGKTSGHISAEYVFENGSESDLEIPALGDRAPPSRYFVGFVA